MEKFFDFLSENSLCLLLLAGGIGTYCWLFAFRKRIRAGWFSVLLLSVLHIVFGVLSVKLFAFLESPGEKFGSSMSLFGAVFFMPCLYFAGSKLFKRNTRQVFDLFTVPLVFTLACARVNCLLTGCCKGMIIPFIRAVTVRWPTREAELLFYAVFLSLIIIRISRNRSNGEIYPLYLLSYGLFRFFVEGFRESSAKSIFHLAHIWAVIAVCAGAAFYFEIRHQKSRSVKK